MHARTAVADLNWGSIGVALRKPMDRSPMRKKDFAKCQGDATDDNKGRHAASVASGRGRGQMCIVCCECTQDTFDFIASIHESVLDALLAVIGFHYHLQKGILRVRHNARGEGRVVFEQVVAQ